MINVAPAAINEQARLKALSEYFILDTSREDGFDDITSLAAQICEVPFSFVSIIDEQRQWFKSTHGLSISETPRDNKFCAQSIDAPDHIFIVNNLADDDRFSTHPMVTGAPRAVFYAGVPLVNPDGFTLGTLCIMDTKEHTLSDLQLKMLRSLGNQVGMLLELRKKELQLKHINTELSYAYGDVEKIAQIASHDLKSPLNNIISLTHLINDSYGKLLDEEGNEYITYLKDASYQLSDLVSGIVSYTRSSQISVDLKEEVVVADLLAEVKAALNLPGHAVINYKKNKLRISIPRIAVKTILTQLIHNAISYNESEHIVVDVSLQENQHSCTFIIKDNGTGIAPEDQEKIFNLFERLNKKKKDGENMGIGLAIAQRLAEKCGGEIKLDSEPGKGSTFILTLPR